jgi:5-methylcytosine-specific restriction endonuclease McrA
MMTITTATRSVEGMRPGPELASALAEVDLSAVDEFEVVEVLKAGRRLASWAASIEVRAAAELERRTVASDGEDAVEFVACEVEAALTLTSMAAGNLMHLARSLDERLPGTLAALSEGRIDVAKARVICDGTHMTSPGVAVFVENAVLPLAPARTTGWLRAAVRKAVIVADPGAFEDKKVNAEASARVELWETPDDTANLAGCDLPLGEASRAFNRITAIATALKTGGDPRPLDYIRALVFQALLLGQDPFLGAELDLPPDPDEHTGHPTEGRPGANTMKEAQAETGAQAHPQTTAKGQATTATVNAKTLAKIQADIDTEARLTADRKVATSLTQTLREALTATLTGVEKAHERVWLIAEAAHRIRESLTALKAPGCTTHTTGDGQIIHGYNGYRPPTTMRHAVQARDERCMFPSCRRPATQSDLDHTLAHHLGGPTCGCNLAALCRHHHRAKGSGGWTLIHLWPGVLLWISPTAHWYLTGPDP